MKRLADPLLSMQGDQATVTGMAVNHEDGYEKRRPATRTLSKRSKVHIFFDLSGQMNFIHEHVAKDGMRPNKIQWLLRCERNFPDGGKVMIKIVCVLRPRRQCVSDNRTTFVCVCVLDKKSAFNQFWLHNETFGLLNFVDGFSPIRPITSAGRLSMSSILVFQNHWR